LTTDAGGLGSYQVTVDRTGLSPGTYTASITITPSDTSLPAVTVPVIQQVGGQGIAASGVGFHYVLLVDPETGQAASSQWSGLPQNGDYHFQLNDVPFPEGRRYIIFAGTDQNKPKTIGAGDSHSGLNFVSGFSIGLQGQSASVIPPRGIAIPRRQTKQVQ